VEVADALADMVYIIVGTALEFGIPLDRVWDEVQRSNMAKVDPVSGRVEKRADGKVKKPQGWEGPRISEALSG
jgi:predicted HAD superfamily Cof-like phosphohydrolase